MIRGFSGETAPENVNPILIGATAYSFVASGAARAWGLQIGAPGTGFSKSAPDQAKRLMKSMGLEGAGARGGIEL